MDLGLKGKRVLVTGSSQGIGLAVAEAFLQEGASVILNARNEHKLVQACDYLRIKYPKEEVSCFSGDMTSKQDILALKEYIVREGKGLDIVIPNVGTGKALAENPLDMEEWERLFRVNLFGAVQLLDNLIDLLKAGKESSIVFISSVAAKEISKAPYAYAAGKEAILVLAKRLSADLAAYQIRVNSVLPGNVLFEGGRWEEILASDYERTMEMIEKTVAMKRLGSPEEIASAVVFLASTKSSFITGSSLVVDGGQLKGI